MNANAQTEMPGSMEIISTRDFAAPRETLFQVFANPVDLAQWWGPKGFSNTITRFDFRPGGAWRFIMHGPDGTDYPNAKDFIEVEESARIVFQHLDPKHRFTMTMAFEPMGNAGGTRLTWRMLFDPNEENEKIKGFIVDANEQNFDRLEAFIAARSSR
jgi:uncharacterized protein YndB with AHSA1/START domain